ncbi:putative metalloprotease [Candidatus Norongarragalina meridionalis]|nr:putative metalloprotease [Candidatus Norongarragalina meridionalis]
MVTVRIKRAALESALEAAKHTYPDEFIGILRGKKEKDGALLTELLIAPFSTYGNGFSSYSDFHIPANVGAFASFHSHPYPPASPSAGDLQFFSRSLPFHLIACPPFESANAFDSKGKQVALEVV